MRKKREILILVPLLLVFSYFLMKFSSSRPKSRKIAPPTTVRLDSANKLVQIIQDSYDEKNFDNYPDAFVRRKQPIKDRQNLIDQNHNQRKDDAAVKEKGAPTPIPVRVLGAPTRKVFKHKLHQNDKIAPNVASNVDNAANEVHVGGLAAEEYETFNLVKCCAAQGVPEKCWHVCSETLSTKERFCPIECSKFIRQALFCSVNGGDYTDCCAQMGFSRSCYPICAGKLPKLDSIIRNLSSAFTFYTECLPNMNIFSTCARENRPKTAEWGVQEWEYDSGLPAFLQGNFKCKEDEPKDDSKDGANLKDF